MATSNSKPTLLVLVTFITFFLLLLNKVKSLDDLSFTFKKFKPNQMDLILQRDATILSTGVLRLTPGNPSCGGAALFSVPVQIWDSTTQRRASFTTSFSFVIASSKKSVADGITFFLGPPNFQARVHGGLLSLFKNNSPNPDKSNQIVAVEFDTYKNEWDPNGPHIVIDVNTIKSIKTVPWNLRIGQVASVTITYDGSLKKLTATLTYPSNKASYTIFAIVDLKAILPEWVRVGLSASTGTVAEENNVRDWQFSSTLKASNYVAMENNVTVAPSIA